MKLMLHSKLFLIKGMLLGLVTLVMPSILLADCSNQKVKNEIDAIEKSVDKIMSFKDKGIEFHANQVFWRHSDVSDLHTNGINRQAMYDKLVEFQDLRKKINDEYVEFLKKQKEWDQSLKKLYSDLTKVTKDCFIDKDTQKKVDDIKKNMKNALHKIDHIFLTWSRFIGQLAQQPGIVSEKKSSK